MNLINKLPDLDWSDVAIEEIGLSGKELVEKSESAWQIGNVAVVGLIYTTYLSPPWFWMALARGVTFRDLLDFRRMAEKIPPGTQTLVNVTNPVLSRFACLYGFRPINAVVEQHGRTYFVMRRD